MTNEEKERVKEMVTEWNGLFLDRVGFCEPAREAIDLMREANKAEQTLLDLIDNQPSEEHLKIINTVLSQINSMEMWATRADYEIARMSLERVRKALGLEGKE